MTFFRQPRTTNRLSFDPANGLILTTPSGYTFSHILGSINGIYTSAGNAAFRSDSGSNPLYGDVIFCFPKEIQMDTMSQQAF